jgi:hypothetical protein
MTSPVPAIQIENLFYAYGRAEAVNGLNLTVQAGRCYGFFGRNGAGKNNQVPSESASAAARASACVWPRSGEGRSCREAAAVLRARPGGVLSLDDGSRNARLPCIVPIALECKNRAGSARLGL